MNIKGLGLSSLSSLDTVTRSEPREKMRATEGGDRDANGRRESDQGKQESPTEEKIQKAIDYLKAHPGVRDNGLTVRRQDVNGKVILLLEDHGGKVVRRIQEDQIHYLSSVQHVDSTKGQIYHRAM